MLDKTQLSNLEKELTEPPRDLTNLSAKEQLKLLEDRSKEMVDKSRLLHQLERAKDTKTPLLVKYGIDPTARNIHLGHIVPIIVARRFLAMGHRVVIVIGDFTAKVGDPTGRVNTRPVLTDEEIKTNVSYYKNQIGRFIDVNKIEIVYNSQFYKQEDMSVADFLKILNKNTISPLLQREDFRKRKDSGLTIAEVLYPTLMAIDSIKLGANVELGGIDQLLNFQTAKSFMVRENVEPETAVTTELLESTAGDGKKMSKSEGNYVSVTADPDEVYGKIMSIPDRLMKQYFTLLTDITNEQWLMIEDAMLNGMSPKTVKQLLARIIVTWLHSASQAKEAEKRFTKLFSKGEVPDDVKTVQIKFTSTLTWLDVVDSESLTKSRSAFRRLVDSNSVKLVTEDNRILSDPFETISKGTHILRYGKGKYIKVIVV